MDIETVGIDLPAKGQPGRASYTVRLRCIDLGVEADFRIKIPVVRTRYKKYLAKVSDVEREARDQLTLFFRRAAPKVSP